VVRLQLPARDEPFDDLETSRRTERHPNGHPAIELDHRRRYERSQLLVERGNATPVGILGHAGACVTGRDRRL
jgi:hypothetical protein